MPQTATVAKRIDPLTVVQRAVLERLLVGESISAAAKAAEIDRGTIYRWMRQDYEFQAELNRQRFARLEASRLRLHALEEAAFQVVKDSLEANDARTAIAVLRGLGLLTGSPLVGAEDPEVLRREAEAEAASRKGAAAERHFNARHFEALAPASWR
jgi:hypothetical protein